MEQIQTTHEVTPQPFHVSAPQTQVVKPQSSIDNELQSLLSSQRATIKVVGCGGGGNNTINRITEVGIKGAETIAINTDAQDLLYTTADKKILIGRELTKGLGAGSEPKIGEEAARESEHEIKQALQGADMVFVTCGLGGGTGTGSAPVVAEVAKKLGALTVGIVTMPFTMEGNRRYQNAVEGLERLEAIVDTLIVIPTDRLLELADIRTVMRGGGVALIGIGESDASDRATEAVEKAISNPLLNVDITGANGALINVSGGPDMTLEEARTV